MFACNEKALQLPLLPLLCLRVCNLRITLCDCVRSFCFLFLFFFMYSVFGRSGERPLGIFLIFALGVSD